MVRSSRTSGRPSRRQRPGRSAGDSARGSLGAPDPSTGQSPTVIRRTRPSSSRMATAAARAPIESAEIWARSRQMSSAAPPVGSALSLRTNSYAVACWPRRCRKTGGWNASRYPNAATSASRLNKVPAELVPAVPAPSPPRRMISAAIPSSAVANPAIISLARDAPDRRTDSRRNPAAATSSRTRKKDMEARSRTRIGPVPAPVAATGRRRSVPRPSRMAMTHARAHQPRRAPSGSGGRG